MSGNPILRDLKARVAMRTAIWPMAAEKRLTAIDEVAAVFSYLWRRSLVNDVSAEEKHAYEVLRRWLRIYAGARL